VARACGSGEDKGRRFALAETDQSLEPGDQGAGWCRREGHGVTDDSAFKKQVRARMAETGENYTTARRTVIAGRDPGQPLPALRVYLNPYVDLELPDAAARAYEAADEQGKREMANRLLAEHVEMAGADEAGVAAGSEIATVQQRRVEEITDVIRRQVPQAAGITSIAVGRDPDHVRVDIRATRPGAAFGHGGAGINQLRAELEGLIGRPFELNVGRSE
jgi:hypothetical protein